jgi:TetR/AcrR family transcriptional repressor of nem operon
MTHSTKQRLIDVGIPMLLEHGYNDLGIQAVLRATGTPKGSFYHHFRDKEDFALQVVDAYMEGFGPVLDACLQDQDCLPLDRVRRFFELMGLKYGEEGYMGCLLGGLGQELSGVNETFRLKIEGCLATIAERLAACLEEARQRGEIPDGCDARRLANILVDCWEGAALRSRLQRNPAPLSAMVDFYIRSVAAV